jgi:hypothetical protein
MTTLTAVSSGVWGCHWVLDSPAAANVAATSGANVVPAASQHAAAVITDLPT